MKHRRPWTYPELRRAMELEQRGLSHQQIGLRLGRTRSSVTSTLRKYRPSRQGRHWLADCEKRLRQLHAQGLHDSEIGRQLGGVSWTAVKLWRKRLGLPQNAYDRTRNGGDRGGGDARRLRALADGLRSGWPGCKLAESRVLTRLYTAGPATLDQLAADLGLVRITVYEHVRELKLRGLVTIDRLPVRGGKGLYCLADGVEPCGTQRSRLDAMRAGRWQSNGHEED